MELHDVRSQSSTPALPPTSPRIAPRIKMVEKMEQSLTPSVASLHQEGFAVVTHVLTQAEVNAVSEAFYGFLHQLRALKVSKAARQRIVHTEATHSRFAWILRSRPAVADIFRNAMRLNPDQLLLPTFEHPRWYISGKHCAHQTAEDYRLSNVDVDVKDGEENVPIYHGFISLTNNVHSSLRVLQRSHLRVTSAALNQLSNEEKNVNETMIFLPVPIGSLVIYDARLRRTEEFSSEECRIVFFPYDLSIMIEVIFMLFINVRQCFVINSLPLRECIPSSRLVIHRY
jgi:hypothetical protein